MYNQKTRINLTGSVDRHKFKRELIQLYTLAVDIREKGWSIIVKGL